MRAISRGIGLGAALLVCSAGAALAGHGKAGLWVVASTTDMAMTMPGVTMPPQAPHSVSSKMCMSQAEVDADGPPHIDSAATGCTTRVTGATPSSMTATTMCDGSLKGRGHMQIVYRGAEHYAGTYSFKGKVEGNDTTMTSSFRGDWIKADCGNVKPYALRTH